MRNLYYKLRGRWLESRAKNKISQLKDREYKLPYDIPYVCQYASPDMAARYVEDENLLLEDPNWKSSGAENIEEYKFWAMKLCGMACFKMILLALGVRDAKLVELGKKALEANVYKKDPNNPKRLIGLLHVPFLKFAKQFGFDGKLAWQIGPYAIAYEILKNNFVIASVSNRIRHKEVHPDDKTGHLVLAHRFKVEGGKISGFYIHNPSGFYNESQENHFVTTEDFINCFSGRIIVLNLNNVK